MHQDYEEKTERMEWQEKEYATVKEVMIEFKKVFERSFVL